MREKKIFYSCVIPSVLAFALSGVYAIVDGFFVGNSIGDAGLASINVAYPVTALIQALGTGIGMGGAILYSIHNKSGRQFERNDPTVRQILGSTLLLLLAGSLLLTLILSFSITPLLKAFGAEGELLTLGREYLLVIVLGAAFQIFGTGLLPFIRNMGGSVAAMFAMMAGFLTNILLDYLFVWVYPFGLAGAALATVIGQIVTVTGCCLFFVRKKIRISLPSAAELPEMAARIGKVALSPFGLTFSPNIVLILMNKFTMLYGGGDAVACYAAIAYIMTIVLLLLQGVGDGSQPLLSRYYGEKNTDRVNCIRRLSYQTAFLFAASCMVILYLARNSVAVLFGASTQVIHAVSHALPVFLSGLLFMAFLRITSSYFYATEKNAMAYILIYAEPLLLFLCLLILPPATGLAGVWLSIPVSQLFTALLALGALRRLKKQTVWNGRDAIDCGL